MMESTQGTQKRAAQKWNKKCCLFGTVHWGPLCAMHYVICYELERVESAGDEGRIKNNTKNRKQKDYSVFH